MKLIKFLIPIFLSITGCHPNSIEELRLKSATPDKFIVQADYHIVYERILSEARNHWRSQLCFLLPAQDVDGDLMEDKKCGTISHYYIDSFGPLYINVIDVYFHDIDKSNVLIYWGVWGKNFPTNVKTIEIWANK